LRVESVRLETATYEVAGTPVIDVSGEIDVYSAPELKSAINKAIDSGAANLIVDLADVGYMDSSGFGILLGATKRLRPKGGRINLVGCGEGIERMLRITGMDTVFGLFPNVEGAVDSLEQE